MAKADEPKTSNEQVTDADAMHERISQRAYELYEQRGRVEGFDEQDWLQAEREIVGRTERATTSTAGQKDAGGGKARIGARAARRPIRVPLA